MNILFHHILSSKLYDKYHVSVKAESDAICERTMKWLKVKRLGIS
jgi:hypothetical protein